MNQFAIKHQAETFLRAIDAALTHDLLAVVGRPVEFLFCDGKERSCQPGEVIEVNGIPIFKDSSVPANSVDLGFDEASRKVEIRVTCGHGAIEV